METIKLKGFADIERARADGAKHGEEDGAVLFRENFENYTSEAHALRGLWDCAHEAAVVLAVPPRLREIWMEAYEAAASATIRGLYREAEAEAEAEEEEEA